jgi:hypothetical protein
MDTVVAFLVTLGMASVSQPASMDTTTANAPVQPAVLHPSEQPAELRVAQERFQRQIEARERIRLTNAWLRALRRAPFDKNKDHS